MVYASSNSIYGATNPTAFSEPHPAADPVSIHAATKRPNKPTAHTYGNIFEFPATGLRYGPPG